MSAYQGIHNLGPDMDNPEPGNGSSTRDSPTSSSAPTLERHPLSAAWGDMRQNEFAELVDSIGSSGEGVDVILFDGQVLDGWHRYQAALSTNAPIAWTEYQGHDPISFVITANGTRRHLSATQRAAAMIRCYEWRTRGRPKKSAQRADNSETDSPVATDRDIAQATGLSLRSVQRLKMAERVGFGDRVIRGELTARQAERLVNPNPDTAKTHRKDELATDLHRTKSERDQLINELIEKGERISELESETRELRDQNQHLLMIICSMPIESGIPAKKTRLTKKQEPLAESNVQMKMFEDDSEPGSVNASATIDPSDSPSPGLQRMLNNEESVEAT